MRDFDCLQASCYLMANKDEIVTKLLNKDEIVMCLGPEPRYTRLCAACITWCMTNTEVEDTLNLLLFDIVGLGWYGMWYARPLLIVGDWYGMWSTRPLLIVGVWLLDS